MNSSVSTRQFHASGKDESGDDNDADDSSGSSFESSSSEAADTSTRFLSATTTTSGSSSGRNIFRTRCTSDSSSRLAEGGWEKPGVGSSLSPSSSSSTFESSAERTRLKRWSYLFMNVNRAVDELYYLCEAEGSTEHCEEVR